MACAVCGDRTHESANCPIRLARHLVRAKDLAAKIGAESKRGAAEHAPKAVAPGERGGVQRAHQHPFPSAVWPGDAQPAAEAQDVEKPPVTDAVSISVAQPDAAAGIAERPPVTGAVSPGASGQPPPDATEQLTTTPRTQIPSWCSGPAMHNLLLQLRPAPPPLEHMPMDGPTVPPPPPPLEHMPMQGPTSPPPPPPLAEPAATQGLLFTRAEFDAMLPRGVVVDAHQEMRQHLQRTIELAVALGTNRRVEQLDALVETLPANLPWRRYIAKHAEGEALIGNAGVLDFKLQWFHDEPDYANPERRGLSRLDYVLVQADGTGWRLHPGGRRRQDAKLKRI